MKASEYLTHEQMQSVANLYYSDKIAKKEIARLFGISKSRAYQIAREYGALKQKDYDKSLLTLCNLLKKEY